MIDLETFLKWLRSWHVESPSLMLARCILLGLRLCADVPRVAKEAKISTSFVIPGEDVG
jgi:hypothetical protein